MLIKIIKRTKKRRFYLSLRIKRWKLSIIFYYKGDEIEMPISLIKWLRKKRFFSTSFGMYFKSLKELDQMWEDYQESFRKRPLNLYDGEEDKQHSIINIISESYMKRPVKNIRTNVSPVTPPPAPQPKEEKE